MTVRRQAFVATLVALAAGLFSMAPALAGMQQVSTGLSMPTQMSLTESASSCDNSPGPYVTLSGELTLGGLGADLIFRNNAKGTHTDVVTTTVSIELIPPGGTVTIPKQPSQGGVGGNPFIWVQILDDHGNALTGEIFLGRCVQGLSDAAASFTLPATLDVTVTADGCTNNPGPYITVSGEMALSGLNARLIFRNNDNPVGGPHEKDVLGHVDVVLIPAGTTITIPKQPVLGGVGGNPWISLVITDAAGNPLTGEIKLGRCVQDF